jgi:hypothetical protein
MSSALIKHETNILDHNVVRLTWNKNKKEENELKTSVCLLTYWGKRYYDIKNSKPGQAWCYMTLIAALGRLIQEDYKFKSGLNYKVRLSLTKWQGRHRSTESGHIFSTFLLSISVMVNFRCHLDCIKECIELIKYFFWLCLWESLPQEIGMWVSKAEWKIHSQYGLGTIQLSGGPDGTKWQRQILSLSWSSGTIFLLLLHVRTPGSDMSLDSEIHTTAR